eukprot:1985375-Prymnesium_polylepis.1
MPRAGNRCDRRSKQYSKIPDDAPVKPKRKETCSKPPGTPESAIAVTFRRLRASGVLPSILWEQSGSCDDATRFLQYFDLDVLDVATDNELLNFLLSRWSASEVKAALLANEHDALSLAGFNDAMRRLGVDGAELINMTKDSPIPLSIAVAKELKKGYMLERRRLPLLTCCFEATIAGQ